MNKWKNMPRKWKPVRLGNRNTHSDFKSATKTNVDKIGHHPPNSKNINATRTMKKRRKNARWNVIAVDRTSRTLGPTLPWARNAKGAEKTKAVMRNEKSSLRMAI